MTKVDIISGFLGAGKTTLIAKLLKEDEKIQNSIQMTVTTTSSEENSNKAWDTVVESMSNHQETPWKSNNNYLSFKK